MWVLFSGIGVSFLLVLAFMWGLAKGAELTRAAQARQHEQLRAAADTASHAHEHERRAWLATTEAASAWLSLKNASRAEQLDKRTRHDEATEAAELAHDATHEALARLVAACDESEAPALAHKQHSEQRAQDRAARLEARERQHRLDDEEHNRHLS